LTSDLQVQVQTFTNAIAMPIAKAKPGRPRIVGAVYDDQDQLIEDTQRAKWNVAWAGNPGRRPELIGPRDTLAGRTFFGGHLRLAFGHVLLEVLPRFWPPEDFSSYDAVMFYTTQVGPRAGSVDLPAYATDLLRALGADPSQCVVVSKTATLIEQLTVPSAALWLKRGFARSVREPFHRAGDELVRQSDEMPTAPRVYLSRSRLGPSSRVASNEDEIEQVVRRRGFVVVHPQELPLRQQVRLVRDAEVIAGCDGSALHLAGFARPGTTLVAFDSRMVPNQLIIDQVAQLDAVHGMVVDEPTSRTDQYVADLRRVEETLDLALG
jgi:capsular polysaccharide biosynthesis protein